MEHHITPLHSSLPPPLDDDGDGEVGSEEEEFGDFDGFSIDSASTCRYSSPSMKPAGHQPNCSYNHLVGQSQTNLNSVNGRGITNVTGKDCNSDPEVLLTNGISQNDHDHDSTASAVIGSSAKEETTFADFTLFTEQAVHPWCCGFTPLVSGEQWTGYVEEKDSSDNLGEAILDSKKEVMESEPLSFSAFKAKENICTVKHCEERDAALVQPSQDQNAWKAAGAALENTSKPTHCAKDEFGSERRSSFDYLQKTGIEENRESDEDGGHPEKRFSTVPKTLSLCESASDTSFCDNYSFDGPSADWEPNVSSLGSLEDQSDWDQTDIEEDEVGNSFVNSNTANFRGCDTGKGFHYCDQSATQETCATSQSGSNTEDKSADFKGSFLEDHRDHGAVQTADAGVQILGNLPPSDSFADFCSAPTQEDGEDSWAQFKDLRVQGEGKTWTRSIEQVSKLQIESSTEEEQDRVGQLGGTRRNSCQASLSCRVQQLLLDSFPEAEVPAAESKEKLLSLSALLQAPQLPDSDEVEEESPEPYSRSPCIHRKMWWPNQDLHSAVGLQFQWGGSYINKTLLRCLGVDTRNIVYIGTKKQPVTVPAFASNLGLLEPTKNSVQADCPPGGQSACSRLSQHMAVTAQAPPQPQDNLDPSTDSMQEALPSSQLDWSSRGLSSSQDGYSNLDLDYFGPEEDSRSSNSSCSSRSNSPPPGVDRELYELTISKLELSTTNSHMEDTLNHLMSTAERTSTSVRKLQPEEELSSEASRVISGLPYLTFMRAKVLMFPSVLVPKGFCSSKLE